MFRIEDGNIKLTAGQSATINVTLTTETGERYAMQKGDQLKLTVAESTEGGAPVLLEKIARTNPTIKLEPSDTINIPVGQYSADIELLTVDGHVYSIYPNFTDDSRLRADMNWRNFWVTPRVSR